MVLIILFLLNILFVGAVWHMDVNHYLDRKGEGETRGVFKLPPEKAYRYSYYFLLAILFLIDALFVMSFVK